MKDCFNIKFDLKFLTIPLLITFFMASCSDTKELEIEVYETSEAGNSLTKITLQNIQQVKTPICNSCFILLIFRPAVILELKMSLIRRHMRLTYTWKKLILLHCNRLCKEGIQKSMSKLCS